MNASDIVTVVAGVVAPLGIVGGAIGFIVKRFDKLDARLSAAEQKYTQLTADHGRLMVQVDRWRIAFRVVSAELRRLAPTGNDALRLAEEMLSEAAPVLGDSAHLDAILNRVEQDNG